MWSALADGRVAAAASEDRTLVIASFSFTFSGGATVVNPDHSQVGLALGAAAQPTPADGDEELTLSPAMIGLMSAGLVAVVAVVVGAIWCRHKCTSRKSLQQNRSSGHGDSTVNPLFAEIHPILEAHEASKDDPEHLHPDPETVLW